MKRVFGAKKDKETTSSQSIQDTSDKIYDKGKLIDKKIERLDSELNKYKAQLNKTKPGPAQETIKARAMTALKQKRAYETQQQKFYSQKFNLDQVAFAAEALKEAQEALSKEHGSSFMSNLFGIGCMPQQR